MNIGLISSSDAAYLALTKDQLIESWGEKGTPTKEIARLSAAGTRTLLGGVPLSIVRPENSDEVKRLLQELQEAAEAGKLERRIGPGLIVLTSVPKVSLKKLSEFVLEHDGYSEVNTKTDEKKLGDEMLEESGFNREVRAYLKDWAGDDFEKLVPIIREFSAFPKAKRAKAKIEDIAIRLPTPPGSIPPWDFIDPMFRGDVKKSVELLRRTVSASKTTLVALSILNSNLQNAWRLAELSKCGSLPSDSELKAMGLPTGFPLVIAKRRAKSLGADKLETMLLIAAEASRKVKTGHKADYLTTVELAVTKIAQLAR